VHRSERIRALQEPGRIRLIITEGLVFWRIRCPRVARCFMPAQIAGRCKQCRTDPFFAHGFIQNCCFLQQALGCLQISLLLLQCLFSLTQPFLHCRHLGVMVMDVLRINVGRWFKAVLLLLHVMHHGVNILLHASCSSGLCVGRSSPSSTPSTCQACLLSILFFPFCPSNCFVPISFCF
jgi:hypothetical protein